MQTNPHGSEETIKRHEDNLKFLISQKNQLDEAILDLQVSLGRYDSTSKSGAASGNGSSCTEDETMRQIMKQENTASGVICWLNSHRELDSGLTDDVLGFVATLGRVEDDNLSRLLSEYLGMQSMLGIVCRSYKGVKALEKYDDHGIINDASSLHGVGLASGKKISGRFLVLCLEDLRGYAGELVASDPQKKLALPKPKLANGECPNGFLEYAVNMINLESKNLSCVTSSGEGLRETLFYSLFSRLQIYKTRMDMLQALPCITDGALSLDGGIIKKSGILSLGTRRDIEVKFPVVSGGSEVPTDYVKSEEAIKMMKWEQANIDGDIRREQELLKEYAKPKLKGQA